MAGAGEPWPVAEVMRRGLAGIASDGAWRYSNIGYAFAGAILAAETGMALGRALQALVLEPAGAVSAGLADTRGDLKDVSGVAAGYHPGWVYHRLLVGELGDAARVLDALLRGRIIGEAALAELRCARALPEFRTALWDEPAYGLGVMAPRLADGRRLIGHTGDGPGSQIAVYACECDGRSLAVAAFSDEGEEAERLAVDALG
ncbi:MAG: serine hydrolase [Caulobacteraceae bacterium]